MTPVSRPASVGEDPGASAIIVYPPLARSAMSYAPHLHAARSAAEVASALIRKAYRGQFDVQLKADASPVTEVDIAAEKVIRQTLSTAFPDHAFYGKSWVVVTPTPSICGSSIPLTAPKPSCVATRCFQCKSRSCTVASWC